MIVSQQTLASPRGEYSKLCYIVGRSPRVLSRMFALHYGGAHLHLTTAAL